VKQWFGATTCVVGRVPLGGVLTRPGQALENKIIYQLSNLIINIVRSVAFHHLQLRTSIHEVNSWNNDCVQGVVGTLVLYVAHICSSAWNALLEVENEL